MKKIILMCLLFVACGDNNNGWNEMEKRNFISKCKKQKFYTNRSCECLFEVYSETLTREQMKNYYKKDVLDFQMGEVANLRKIYKGAVGCMPGEEVVKITRQFNRYE